MGAVYGLGGAGDGSVVGYVERGEQFDGAGEVAGSQGGERQVAFFGGARAQEDVVGGAFFGEELGGELEADAAVCLKGR